MQAEPRTAARQQANKSTQTPKVFRSKSGSKKRASSVYAEQPTTAPVDHDSDNVVHQETQALFYTPTSSDIDASPTKTTQPTPALAVTSSESTQTDASPMTLNESVQTAPEDPAIARYDLINRSTLKEAFAAAFTIPLDHDVAQAKFTEAAADYYLTTAIPLYDDFKALLKANLTKNAIHRTSSFCQVFLSVTGYVHVFTETDVAGMITREFADATMGSKDPHRKFVEIVLPAGAYSEFHCNGFVTKFNQLFRFRGAIAPQEDIDRCYIRNETLLQEIDERRQNLAQVTSSRNDHRLEDGLAKHAQMNMKAEELRIRTNKLLAALRDA